MTKKKRPQILRPIVNVHLSPDTPIMPDGRPLPDLCDAMDVILYLRIGDNKEDPGGANKQRALAALREKGWLVGFKCGRNVKFTKQAVLECLRRMQEERVA